MSGFDPEERELGEREELWRGTLKARRPCMRYCTQVQELGHVSHGTGWEGHRGAGRTLATGPKWANVYCSPRENEEGGSWIWGHSELRNRSKPAWARLPLLPGVGRESKGSGCGVLLGKQDTVILFLTLKEQKLWKIRQQDGSRGKDTCYQAQWPEFKPRRREGVSKLVLQPPDECCGMHAHRHTSYMNTCIYSNKGVIGELNYFKIKCKQKTTNKEKNGETGRRWVSKDGVGE